MSRYDKAICRDRTCIAILAVLTAGPLVGCKPSNIAQQADNASFIAVVGVAEDDPIWRVLYATATRQVDTLGGLAVRTAIPADPTPHGQIRLLRELYSRRMLGLCIQPADGPAMREILEELRSKGVTVVTMLERAPSQTEFMHAGVDDMAVGRAMADAIQEAVGGDGTIAVMRGPQDDLHYTDRYVGFEEKLKGMAGIHVLREFECDGNEFVARRQVREFTERFPRLSGWVCMDNWPLRLLEPDERPVPEGCVMVTYNPLPQYWPLIHEDACRFISVPYDQVAEQALHMCATAIHGELPSSGTYLAPPVTITSQNIIPFKLQWFRWREVQGAAESEDESAPSDAREPAAEGP